MKNIATSIAFLIILASGTAMAAADLSLAEVVNRHQNDASGCAKNEIGKITKVEVLSGKQLMKFFKGQTEADVSKRYILIYVQRGKLKDYNSPSGETVAADVTSAELTAKLMGKPACVSEPQD